MVYLWIIRILNFSKGLSTFNFQKWNLHTWNLDFVKSFISKRYLNIDAMCVNIHSNAHPPRIFWKTPILKTWFLVSFFPHSRLYLYHFSTNFSINNFSHGFKFIFFKFWFKPWPFVGFQRVKIDFAEWAFFDNILVSFSNFSLKSGRFWPTTPSLDM